ncbi:MAG TPA: hypothetical protein VN257_04545 [Actinotalea sp.]|nr:hypothetical protein [Actinotalea sp.]
MHVLVHVHGNVDDVDLWPLVARGEPLGDDVLVTLEVADGRELVGALIALTQRGLRILRVDTLEPDQHRLPR